MVKPRCGKANNGFTNNKDSPDSYRNEWVVAAYRKIRQGGKSAGIDEESLPAETVAQLQNVISTGGRNPILDSFETSLYVRD